MSTLDMSGEKYSHLASGQFDARESADRAIASLLQGGMLRMEQVSLIQPGDNTLDSQVEPETDDIRRTLVKSHFILGLAGLIVGLLLATGLVIFGPEATRSSPLMTYIGLGVISTFFGLLLAGLFTLRPDHDHVLTDVRSASGEGRWTVVAHCADEEERSRALAVLEEHAQDTSQSL